MQVPCEELETIWESYSRFEHTAAGRNHMAATRFIDEARPRFHAAREAWAIRRTLLAPLNRDALPWTPGRSPPSAQFAEQRKAWLALLEFEAANTQGLAADVHVVRLDLACKQALQPLRACPEVRYARTHMKAWPQRWLPRPADAHTSHRALHAWRTALPLHTGWSATR